MEEDIYDPSSGEITSKEPIYEVFERQVEDIGDGTGQFLWPRQSRGDGKFFGFDAQILAKKRAQYLDKAQFRAQYYNDPNDPESASISKEKFQYYERRFLTRTNGKWYYKDRRLNIFASIDFAYSLSKRSDYSAIAVVGVDYDKNYYVLDIVRFQTDKISEYYKEILNAHVKWDFRKLRAETSVAQTVIVKELKSNYIQKNGIGLSIDEHKPNRYVGSKEERIKAILEPKYDDQKIWHYLGGNCQILEEELVLGHPPHDDCKDALASVIEICIPPTGQSSMLGNVGSSTGVQPIYNKRFGGVSY
jgi:phage terminase large subunit-like protein